MTLQDTPVNSSTLSAEEDEATFVEREIHALEGTSFHWLQFRAALEARFEEATAKQRLARMWVNGIFCTVLYNLFVISDYQMGRASFSHSVMVRLGLATPVAVVALALLRRGVPQWLRESLVVVVCATFALSIVYLYAGANPVVSGYALTDLAMLVLFTNVGIHIRLPYAVAASTIVLLLGGLYIQFDHSLSGPETAEGAAILIAGTLLSLVANYNIERGERLNFLLRLRSEYRAAELATSNEHLLRLSNEDRLTRLPNRRRFDQLYRQIWQQCLKSKSPISVVMIDIDNFKDLNDRYGHLYGDAVLSRIAALLPPALRGKGDFVARYGGEEFVVVLPDATNDAGVRVAERIRQLIELAGSPPPTNDGSRDHGWSTVSCGVATAVPHSGVVPSSLIEMADKALYRAKAEGRNRVCCQVP